MDTSVVLRLLAGEPEDLALAALRWLRRCQAAGDSMVVAELVVAETYHAFQYHYGASKKETLDALRRLLAAPGIEGLGEIAILLNEPQLESAKPGFVDRLIHSSYLRAGADEMVTFERAAAKLPGVRVLAAGMAHP